MKVQSYEILIPRDAWPETYDPVTHRRTSPDIRGYRMSDGIWYHADGIRDETRSPKEDLRHLI
ncbi:MAG: hypothetical protein HYW24_00525 [Candidatus Aenigmarchaeota archaeon]|nr:hypothetical protein [Candidatus Aenigmarchaeota archaeon]